ncbi:cobyric acid synthase [uncultured Microscilla sp.]|uniref:cobyric acid synthase n=1 Tax=uncultured Microscilla sp. TaxID=432653 RepID=UPI002639B124|nr:cobyric acid synthase [uncultured Microscilla sp.]
MKKLKPLMFVGTASDVGKSIINAGFCRILAQDGYHPAPFKAQNMSLNSYVTKQGLELGRAQAVQAEAAGIDCLSDMNPVLLKPTSEQASQVVLHGKPVGNRSAFDYFANDKAELFTAVTQAYDRLAQQYNPIVIEGAGSISELNLKKRDITNMRIALHAQANTYLISDIERGGVFGSVYGTIALLPPEERRLIKGIIVNKFRGDSRLFEDGRQMLEEITGVPVVGVLPYFTDIHIEEEDALGLEKRSKQAQAGTINVAVVLLRRLSNFTDFDVLEKDPRVNLYYTNHPEEIRKADIAILPGSKNVIQDLSDIKRNGAAQAIIELHKNHKTVIGICGGYQMLGQYIEDPHRIESNLTHCRGLGILPLKTVLTTEKTTLQRDFHFDQSQDLCQGYEIHMGKTEVIEEVPGLQPLNRFADSSTEGYQLNNDTWGTYMHGILDNPVVIDRLLARFNPQTSTQHFDYQSFKETQYNKLADYLRTHLDMDYIYKELLD